MLAVHSGLAFYTTSRAMVIDGWDAWHRRKIPRIARTNSGGFLLDEVLAKLVR